MGVSIDIHVYDYADLIKQITEVSQQNEKLESDRTVTDFVERVLPEFGFRSEDKWVTLWNEYYEDYNSGSELFRAVELYFGVDDVYLGDYTWHGNANAREVLEALGIEPIEGVEDE